MLLPTVESLRIGGEDREGLAAQWRHRPEGALVKAGDSIGSMPVGQHGKRGVGKAQLEVPVATRQVAGHSQLFAIETIDDEGSRREVVEELEPPAQHELERRLAGLRGEIELPIPAASAVKDTGMDVPTGTMTLSERPRVLPKP